MSQVSTPDVVNLFKKVYGDLQDLVPEDYKLQKDILFEQKQKVGESYVEAMVLTRETGITFGGSGMDAFDINPAIAGAVKQTVVVPYTKILASVVPMAVLSRSAGGGEKAFYDGTKHIVKNNIKSHGAFSEIVRWYGQSPDLLGYVSYATATYRGVALTNGTGTVNGVAFVNGVSAGAQAILLAPGQFAAGIWVGQEGCVLQEVDSTNVVVQEGKLIGVDAEYGILYTDFVPTAASAVSGSGSYRLCFQGMAEKKEAIGVKAIMAQQTGTLFGINVASYNLWRGNYINNNALKFKFGDLNRGIAQAVNRGGLDGALDVYVNPRTWGTLIETEAGKRVYDKSYTATEAENGMEAITFYSQNGKATIKPHRMVKEGDAAGLYLPDWSRSGSAEISFTVPGIDKEIIFPLENQAAMAFRSFSDEYVFNHGPARSIFWTGINDESAT